jgi:SAM-dependent methyltransferase
MALRSVVSVAGEAEEEAEEEDLADMGLSIRLLDLFSDARTRTQSALAACAQLHFDAARQFGPYSLREGEARFVSSAPQAQAPQTFDRRLVRARLTRAAQSGFADFLIARCTEDMADRLSLILRDFGTAADIGTPTHHAVEALRHMPRVGSALRLAPTISLAQPGDLVADEEALPLQAASLNLAVSLLSLQNTNDLPGTLIQIRRALKPDGLFLAALYGGSTLTELRQCFLEAEAETTGGVTPHVSPFADLRDMGGLLQRAGFMLPVADSDVITVRYGSIFSLFADLRGMGLTNALMARSRKPLRRATLTRLAEIYTERFADPDGKIRASFEILWLSGWAAHDSQQQPLKPGSAKARLADALKTIEISGGEKVGE